MANLKQYELVRVCELNASPQSYDGWRVNKRPPEIGDVGTLIDILHAQGLPDRYVVECSVDGVTIWLADFEEAELEYVTPAN